MTELQMGLVGLGATAVVGVLAFNRWQEYRHRKMAEAILTPRHEDVLLSGSATVGGDAPVARAERLEPAFESADETSDRAEPSLGVNWPQDGDDIPEVNDAVLTAAPEFSAAPAEPDVLPETAAPAEVLRVLPPDEPLFESSTLVALPDPVSQPSIAEQPVAAQAPGNVPAELLDSRIELIAGFDFASPIPIAQAVQAQRATLARLHKPVHWVGFDAATREWQRMQPDSTAPVSKLRIGLQLVNRQGPVPDSDVATFTHAMHALAAEHAVACDLRADTAHSLAEQIDRFCAGVDLEIGINIVSRAAAFPGTKIRALAEASGMVLGNGARFVRFDEAGYPLFSLINFESTPFSPDSLRSLTTHGVTFLLDVPCVAHGEQVWGQMTEMARRFAETLQGELVDDNRQPLNTPQLEHIRREFIAKPQAAMATFGLPAGSAQARRLFS